jgi:hypothetical protein
LAQTKKAPSGVNKSVGALRAAFIARLLTPVKSPPR